MGDSKIKTSRQNLEQLAGSSEICNQSSDFATYENQDYDNTVSGFPHQYLVKL